MTTISSAVSNYMFRRQAERVDTEEPEDIREQTVNRGSSDSNSIADGAGEEGQFIGGQSAGESRTIAAGNDESESSSQRVPMLEGASNSPEIEIASDAESPRPTTTQASSRRRRLRGLTLRDLEEEREVVQRRRGGCLVFAVFVLLRLWIQALMTGDYGLLVLCLVFTRWTAIFLRSTMHREEELNRMINEWDEDAENEQSGLNDTRLSRMSFQSQVALAIMQSQIQIMEGGYGHPDGGENKPGVSEDDRGDWDTFEYKSPEDLLQKECGDCNPNNDGGKTLDDEDPTCSICLCEYEKGENLIMLPCKHAFHKDCIDSWTEHNTRCPLCNADLTSSENNIV